MANKIYLASSWNMESAVNLMASILRNHRHEVDVFCDDSKGRYVFYFDQIPDIEEHDGISVMYLGQVRKAFYEDKKWIDWSDTVLLMLPSGRSAHLEAGYAKAAAFGLKVLASTWIYAALVLIVSLMRRLSASSRRGHAKTPNGVSRTTSRRSGSVYWAKNSASFARL